MTTLLWCYQVRDGAGCCSSCHGDWNEGYASPHEIYQSDVEGKPWSLADDPVVGQSCCIKYDEVLAELRARPTG